MGATVSRRVDECLTGEALTHIPGWSYRRDMDIELRHLRVDLRGSRVRQRDEGGASLGLAQPALTRSSSASSGTLVVPVRARSRGARPTPLASWASSSPRPHPGVKACRTTPRESAGIARRWALPDRRHQRPDRCRLVRGSRPHTRRRPSPRTRRGRAMSWWKKLIAADRLRLAGCCGDSVPSVGDRVIWRAVCVDAVGVLLPDRHRWPDSPKWSSPTSLGNSGPTRRRWLLQRLLRRRVCAGGLQPRAHSRDRCEHLLRSRGERPAVVLAQGTCRRCPGLYGPDRGTPLSWRHYIGWRPAAPPPTEVTRYWRRPRPRISGRVASRPWYAAWLSENPHFGAIAVK